MPHSGLFPSFPIERIYFQCKLSQKQLPSLEDLPFIPVLVVNQNFGFIENLDLCSFSVTIVIVTKIVYSLMGTQTANKNVTEVLTSSILSNKGSNLYYSIQIEKKVLCLVVL